MSKLDQPAYFRAFVEAFESEGNWVEKLEHLYDDFEEFSSDLVTFMEEHMYTSRREQRVKKAEDGIN